MFVCLQVLTGCNVCFVVFKSGAYIVFALLTGAVMIAASGLVLYVFMPMVLMVSEDMDPADIIRDVTFTNMDKT